MININYLKSKFANRDLRDFVVMVHRKLFHLLTKDLIKFFSKN